MVPVTVLVVWYIALTALGPASVAAQGYPSRPIRLVVPFTPGGGSDIVGRIVGQKLANGFGQSVVIDNRPGAAGIIGTDLVAKAAPDGYTLLLGSGSHSINASLGRKLPYDALADFAPVSRLATIPNVLVVHPSVPVGSVKEIIALAKAKPGQLNYGSAGSGSTNHLAMGLFNSLARVEMVHVPYKGSSPAEADLLAGRIQLMFAPVTALLQQVRAGNLRAIAVSSVRRSPLVPDLPTIAESGVPGFAVESWYGVLAPARTSREAIAKLNNEIGRILQMPEVRERLAGIGAEPIASTPGEFAAHIKSEIAMWVDAVKRSGVRID